MLVVCLANKFYNRRWVSISTILLVACHYTMRRSENEIKNQCNSRLRPRMQGLERELNDMVESVFSQLESTGVHPQETLDTIC